MHSRHDSVFYSALVTSFSLFMALYYTISSKALFLLCQHAQLLSLENWISCNNFQNKITTNIIAAASYPTCPSTKIWNSSASIANEHQLQKEATGCRSSTLLVFFKLWEWQNDNMFRTNFHLKTVKQSVSQLPTTGKCWQYWSWWNKAFLCFICSCILCCCCLFFVSLSCFSQQYLKLLASLWVVDLGFHRNTFVKCAAFHTTVNGTSYALLLALLSSPPSTTHFDYSMELQQFLKIFFGISFIMPAA